MDFTANEGSGLNSTRGSNPPVSAFGPGPWTGAFCVAGLPVAAAAHYGAGTLECAVRTTDAQGGRSGSVAGLVHGGTQQLASTGRRSGGMESTTGTIGGGNVLHGVPGRDGPHHRHS